MRRNILGDHCPGTDNCPLPDGNPGQYHAPRAQPYSIAYCYRTGFHRTGSSLWIMEIMSPSEQHDFRPYHYRISQPNRSCQIQKGANGEKTVVPDLDLGTHMLASNEFRSIPNHGASAHSETQLAHHLSPKSSSRIEWDWQHKKLCKLPNWIETIRFFV